MTCTAIWTALVYAKARGVTIPRVLYLQIDGGSENWNLTVFAFFAYLVTVGIFDRVQLRRLPVGCGVQRKYILALTRLFSAAECQAHAWPGGPAL
jgi:hypothetical protein